MDPSVRPKLALASRQATIADVEAIWLMVNAAYELEKGSSGVGFKREEIDRFGRCLPLHHIETA